jgi:nuclear cap-binding protein subunit 1
MASSSTDSQELAASLLDKTGIVTGQPHPLEALVDPYPGYGKDRDSEPTSVISLLQKQLQNEAASGWELACIPRPWKMTLQADQEDHLAISPKHSLPPINVPEAVVPGPRPLFPEIFFSVYANQDVETVPPTSDVASCLLRDSLVDTINILDFNRNATARFLIDLDCYFSPGTFVKRATPFDRLKDVEVDRSTWKPEDVAVDAVFSQLFQLPSPEHKLVYYHSVLTEACKIAPAAIAPSLGRAIRYLYRHVDQMDLELGYRFMDWFSHHLSNFGFTWKWTEWENDVDLPSLHPKKAFIQGALDKEIRLSFAQRIKGTLPVPYQPLISEAKEKDTPDFKYNDDGWFPLVIIESLLIALDTPFSAEGRELLVLLKRKALDSETDPVIDRIHTLAATMALSYPLLASTDAYVTCICYIGSKSLSHVLSCIDRCKDRLISISTSSSPAQRQIIESVMDYWHDQPGIGVSIVDKLLNYSILTPLSVVEWALGGKANNLAESHVLELVMLTVQKVVRRVRGVVKSRDAPDLPADQQFILDKTLTIERANMRAMFQLMEDALVGWAQGSKDQLTDGGGSEEEDELIKQWGERWLKVFRRRVHFEEAWLAEAENAKTATIAKNGGMDIET